MEETSPEADSCLDVKAILIHYFGQSLFKRVC